MLQGPGPADRYAAADIVQHVAPTRFLDLGPGYLDPELVSIDTIGCAYSAALARYGDMALAYGHNQGSLPYRAALARHLTRTDAEPWTPSHLLTTAGTSQALDTLTSAISHPGDVVLTEAPTYDLALNIFRDHGLTVSALACDADGPDPEAMERTVESLRSSGRRVAFAYLIPTFHNPTARLMPTPRRKDLIAAAQRQNLLIVEDDAYADLSLDGTETPPSLTALAKWDGVLRLGTFSKTLAPGLRLGWLGGSPRLCRRLADRGVAHSGGSPSHLTALAVAELMHDGSFVEHLERLRVHLAHRRDALSATLREHLRHDFTLRPVRGGLFTWVELPRWLPEQEAVARASAVGVAVQPGSRFGSPDSAVRLAYSAHPPTHLRSAAARLADVWNQKG
ncbi:aminotransferase class I/II-fold pyridoxal phosphate-dependent enzyme [Streptomyces sp. NPDC008086]|uniref:aminotransferase class I/II-fold pyridoxal phosphate-dependent enzyme n=1 Tax=Streptomyces sp. NPDC008086 TaxID=3364807 RepID=UPI0036E40BEF